MIEVRNVSKTFAGKKVLNNINAVFQQGKTNLIIGQSGSGKTVLLKTMVGLHEPDEGEILFDGRVFNRMDIDQKREIRKEIGMLFQGSALFDMMTVEENVKFPLSMFTNMSESEKADRANLCLKRVNLINVNKLYPSELSGGMQKRVAIARAIAMNPKYLFCDEPNSGLDPKTAMLIDDLIKELTHEYQTTTIINTHDMNSVLEIGENIIFIYQGNKWWQGTKEEVLQADNKELNDFIFATKYLKKFSGK